MRISDWSADVCSSDLRRRARLDLAADEMGGHFGIGLRFNAAPAGLKLFPQFLEVFDDAAVDQRYLKRCVRVGGAGGGRAVRRPAGMCASDPSGPPTGGKRLPPTTELSSGAPPSDLPVDDGQATRPTPAPSCP